MSQTLAESETMLNGDATTTKAFVQESGGGTSARDPNANKSNFLWPHILPRPSKNPNQICLAATTVVCCTGMVAMAIAMVLLLRPGLFLNQAHFKNKNLVNRWHDCPSVKKSLIKLYICVVVYKFSIKPKAENEHFLLYPADFSIKRYTL